MLSKVIEYENFNGETVKKTFYFGLNETELSEMEMTTPGGLTGLLQRIIDAKDQGAIYTEFKTLILKAYGEKSPDGEYFMKNDKIREAFEHHPAFNELFLELGNDDKAAAAFIKGIMSKNIQQKIEAENKSEFHS